MRSRLESLLIPQSESSPPPPPPPTPKTTKIWMKPQAIPNTKKKTPTILHPCSKKYQPGKPVYVLSVTETCMSCSLRLVR